MSTLSSLQSFNRERRGDQSALSSRPRGPARPVWDHAGRAACAPAPGVVAWPQASFRGPLYGVIVMEGAKLYGETVGTAIPLVRDDCLPEEAVFGEPLSASNSLLNRENTGNFPRLSAYAAPER